jgi:hypothetical protein
MHMRLCISTRLVIMYSQYKQRECCNLIGSESQSAKNHKANKVPIVEPSTYSSCNPESGQREQDIVSAGICWHPHKSSNKPINEQNSGLYSPTAAALSTYEQVKELPSACWNSTVSLQKGKNVWLMSEAKKKLHKQLQNVKTHPLRGALPSRHILHDGYIFRPSTGEEVVGPAVSGPVGAVVGAGTSQQVSNNNSCRNVQSCEYIAVSERRSSTVAQLSVSVGKAIASL